MKQLVVLPLAAGLAATPVLADDRDTILESCRANLGMSAAGCDCIADRVEAEFDEQQMAFFISMITRDQAAAAKLRGQMTVNQLTQVGSRMTELPTECAR